MISVLGKQPKNVLESLKKADKERGGDFFYESLHMCRKCGVIFLGGNNSKWCIHCLRREKPRMKGQEADIKKNLHQSCYFCGSTSKLELHHKDMDALNNTEENCTMICLVCHRRLHTLIKKVIDRLWREGNLHFRKSGKENWLIEQ